MLFVARRQHQSMGKEADGPGISIARPMNDLEFHLEPSRANVRRGDTIWMAVRDPGSHDHLFFCEWYL